MNILLDGGKPYICHEDAVTITDEIIHLYIDQGHDIDIKHADGFTLLGYGNDIKLILDQGADPNIEGLDGYTCLHLTVINGNITDTDLLLLYGADPNIQNHAGNTPYTLASEGNHHEIAKLLSEYVTIQ